MTAAAEKVRELGIFRARDFSATGFPREYLRRLVKTGALRKLRRGLYAAADFEGDQHLTLLEVCLRLPQAVVCLGSALQFHGIGTQSPRKVWVALPRSASAPRSIDLPVRCCAFTQSAYAFGVEEHSIRGGVIRVYSPAKTVADCFKFRHKHGLDVAIEALREGWQDKRFTMPELAAATNACRVSRVMQPYLEMLP